MNRVVSCLRGLRAAGLLSALVLSTGPAYAQAPADVPTGPAGPAKGPADLINRANAQREQKALAQPAPAAPAAPAPVEAPAPAQAAPTEAAAPEASPQPGGAAPHPVPNHASGGMMDAPRLATAVPDRFTKPGTIRVSVRDLNGAPVANADVQLGIMRQGGQREAKAARSDASGNASFEGLDTGAAGAYRVNLVYDGAKVSSTPFRLPEGVGYRVAITKLPVSREERLVFQMIGQVMVELKDERLHVTQQARITNVGQEVYLFPQGGLFVPLPEGYISPQFQEVMSDQKLVEKPGEGFTITGSLPPGTVTLAWGYDLPRTGSDMRVAASVPWRTYMFRVISEAPPGMGLKVSGMPEPQQVDDQGRQLWLTQVQRTPEDAPMKQVVLLLNGIPGPGPARWVAVGAAVLALLFALWAALVPGKGDELRKRLVGERKQRLLDEVKDLGKQKDEGEVGPEFYQERLDALMNDLAMVLRDEQMLEGRGQKA